MKKTFIWILPVVMLGLAGCSSNVTRSTVAGAKPIATLSTQPQKVATVKVKLSPTAQTQLAENLKFDPTRFSDTLQRGLNAKNLVTADSQQDLVVEITDIRVRSTFSAVMWGFMAGNDHVVGTVSVIDKAGKLLQSFEVSASYALGGVMGGDESRMSWLYEKFTEHVLKELSGTAAS